MSDFVNEEDSIDDDDDEILFAEGQEEVEVLDNEPDDPDGGLEVIMEDEVEIDPDDNDDGGADPDLPPDLAYFTFSGHTDSVYCAAIHPTRIGVVITGE